MKVFLFTDPHIGLSRASHTSVRSRKLLQHHLYMHAVEIAKVGANDNDVVICVGDLFDRYTNKEDIILQGGDVADYCDYVLAGNHDLKNNVDTMSSFQLLMDRPSQNHKRSETKFVISEDPTQPYVSRQLLGSPKHNIGFHRAYFIPHCFTQEAFVASIEQACAMNEEAGKRDEVNKIHSYLFLHCNVGEAHGKVEDEGTTLALTDDLQKRVSECFTRVLIGHEHSPRTLRGNIHVLGNTFPVHFGEIGDRFSYVLDIDTNELTATKIFSEADDFKTFQIDDFLEQKGEINTAVGLVEITGEVKAEEYSEFSRALQKFWRLNEESLFAVKNSVVIKHAAAVQKVVRGGRASLREVIGKEVVTAGYGEEFAEISRELGSDS